MTRGTPGVRISLRTMQWGCLPLALIAACGALLMINVVITGRTYAPSSLLASTSIAERAQVSLLALLALEVAACWLLGLLTAVRAGALLKPRGAAVADAVRRSRQQVIVGAWAVVVLRVLTVGAAAAVLLSALTARFGPRAATPLLMALVKGLGPRRVLLAASMGLVAINLLIGPFLRVRASAALGALGAASAADPNARPWRAASARLGAGLFGLMALVWGATLALLAYQTAVDPVYYLSQRQYYYSILGGPQLGATAVLAAAACLDGILIVTLIGQIVLPSLMLRRATRWMARRAVPSTPIDPAAAERPALVAQGGAEPG